MPEAIDTPNANMALMRDAFSAMQRRDIDACLAMLADDFFIDVAGAPIKRGRAAWRQNAEILFTAFSDIELHIEQMFAAADMVAVRLRLSGTHTGEFLGQAGTGKRFDYKSIELYRVIDGKIVAEWINSDTLTLMTQIGTLSGRRLIAIWLAGYRFWFGAAIGTLAGIALAIGLQALL